MDGPGVTIFRGLRSLFYHFLCMGCLASTSAHITRAAHNTARKCARVHVSDLCVYLVSCVCRNLRARGTVRKLCRHHEQRSREGPVRRAAPSLCNHFPWKIGCRGGRRPRWRSRFSQVAQIKATKRLAAAQEEANRIANRQAGRPSPFQAPPAAASPRTNFFTPQHAVVHFSGCAVGVACA